MNKQKRQIAVTLVIALVGITVPGCGTTTVGQSVPYAPPQIAAGKVDNFNQAVNYGATWGPDGQIRDSYVHVQSTPKGVVAAQYFGAVVTGGAGVGGAYVLSEGVKRVRIGNDVNQNVSVQPTPQPQPSFR